MYSPSPSNNSYMAYANKAGSTANTNTATTNNTSANTTSSNTSPLNSLLSAASLLLSDSNSSAPTTNTTTPSANTSNVVASKDTTNSVDKHHFNSEMFDGYLELQDGTRYYGKLFGANKCLIDNDANWNSPYSVSGECVFTTAMVGYPESITDPSYHGQILVLTFPMIGNYGAPNFKSGNSNLDEFGLIPKLESDKIHIRGLIVQDYSHNYSHYEAICSLHRWLQEYNIPALYQIDTRSITKKLTTCSMLARIVTNIHYEEELSIKGLAPLKWYDPGVDSDIIARVSSKQVKIYGLGNQYKVVAIDCGMKYNIIRELVKRDVELKVVPYNYNWLDLDVLKNVENGENGSIDGLFISNGPGNPNNFHETISILSNYLSLLSNSNNGNVPLLPIFGICLGNQLVGKAIGATVYKLPFGNRGHNQPVIDQLTHQCYITSQNHGYAIDNQSLPSNFKPYFINANDQSNEGIYCLNLPLFTAQFHPEAKGGPSDTYFLFDQFIEMIKLKKNQKLEKIKNFESYYSNSSRLSGSSHKSSSRSKLNRLLKSVDDCTSDISTPIMKQQELLMKKSIFNSNATTGTTATGTTKKDENIVKVLPKKVIVLGSGGLQIGQAGEFDYSGSQAIKALKEEGIYTILVNPNIATVQTCKELADQVYFGPVTPDFVEKVIKKEGADGLLLSFGGQTALNCGVQLHKSGVLETLNCKVLGTPVQSIIDTEDRDIFNQKMREIQQPIADSKACDNVDEAIQAASMIGYPVIIRAAFALGGLGSGFANDERELKELVIQALSSSPQILVEKSVKGWKEVEYEVVRDCADNCITVCNMENFDPVGIHTGESIVVAPSQTLNNDEYHMLRTAAIKVIRHLGIVGECNIQYALHPYSKQYVIIEVNARLSRSSALASKATGYPLAFVAAKLSLGKRLIDIKNSITKKTIACFEPALDYCVVKMPRWDLKKFARVSTTIGSAMKSVGEVMAIGRNFEEAIQKAIRMVDSSAYRGFDSCNSSFDLERLLKQSNTNHHLASTTNYGNTLQVTPYGSFGQTQFGSFGQTHYGSFGTSAHSHLFQQKSTHPTTTNTTNSSSGGSTGSSREEIKQKIIRELTHPTDQRIFALSLAMEHFDMTIDQLHHYTQIDRWFLYKLQNIVQTRKAMIGVGTKLMKSAQTLRDFPYPLMLLAKQQGFSDLQIAACLPSKLYYDFYRDEILSGKLQFPYKLSPTISGSAGLIGENVKLTKIDKELLIRFIRIHQFCIQPIVKQIDTLAAEYPAQTNYLYTTYNSGINSIAQVSKDGDGKVQYLQQDHHYHHDVTFPNKNSQNSNKNSNVTNSTIENSTKKSVIVLGSGVYRIGSSVEFDYCAVMSVRELKRLQYNTILINYNPETVSTDYDEPDRLYFEELNLERVLDIYELEQGEFNSTISTTTSSSEQEEVCEGVIVSVGGQQPNNIVLPLDKQCGVKILGTSSDSIDQCEDRSKFSQLLDSISSHPSTDTTTTTTATGTTTTAGKNTQLSVKSVYQPEWANLTTIEDALQFANHVKYPVLIRPSYVLSGAAMNVAYSDSELLSQLFMAADVSKEHPVVISKFYENAKEIEIDGVALGGEIVIDALSEHVERAGTHSGDATLICPPYSLHYDLQQLIRQQASLIVRKLNISGPFNMQFLFDQSDDQDEDQSDDQSDGQDESESDSDGKSDRDGGKSELVMVERLARRLRVIECNLRASRSFPFISKVMDLDFIALATRIFTKQFELPNMGNTKYSNEYEMIQKKRSTSFYGCKSPMFSFRRLLDCDPKLGVEMASTGEVACFGETVRDAFLKSIMSSSNLAKMVNSGNNSILIASFPHSTRPNMELINQILQSIYILSHHLKFQIYVSPYVSEKLSQQLPNVKFNTLQLQQYIPVPPNLDNSNNSNGLCLASQLRLDDECEMLKKIASTHELDFIVDVPFADSNQKLLQQHYLIRRKAINYDKILFNNYEVFNLVVRCLKDLKDRKMELDDLEVNPYSHYLNL